MDGSSHAYPSYKFIELSDKDIFEKFCKRYPPYSDFNLLSLLSWDANKTYKFSILNDNLVLRIKDYLGDRFLYSLLGENLIDQSLTALLKETNKLSFVPEVVVNKIQDRNRFVVQEDRDNDDYMISLGKIIKLEGREYKHLRRDVHHFKKTYPGYETKLLDLKDRVTKEEVIYITKKWFLDKDFDKKKQEDEIAMLYSFMEDSQYFNCANIGLFVEDRLIAYIFNEQLQDKFIISHFGVSDKDFERSSYMMEYANAQYFFVRDFTYQNMEQDTGLPGLRATKVFYNPEYFLKKYTISLK